MWENPVHAEDDGEEEEKLEGVETHLVKVGSLAVVQ